MELNGLANTIIVLNGLKDQLEEKGVITQEIRKSFDILDNQLDTLERYMVAVGEKVDSKKIPAWHEVRDNPTKYPKNSERFRS